MGLFVFTLEFSRQSSASKNLLKRKAIRGAPITILMAVPRIAVLPPSSNAGLQSAALAGCVDPIRNIRARRRLGARAAILIKSWNLRQRDPIFCA